MIAPSRGIDVIHPGAAEFSREFLCDFAASKKPKHIIPIFVPLAGKNHMNAALFVKGEHCIEPLSEAARWHGNFHAQRKLAGLRATSAFVPSRILPPELPPDESILADIG